MPFPTIEFPHGRIINADCLAAMKEMPDNSVDAILTDPPYGLSTEPDIAEVMQHWINGDAYEHKSSGGMMGKSWDSFVPGPEYWKEVIRILKPGGHIAVFAATRTWDLMSIALRFAGFQNRDTILHEFGPPLLAWTFGSGFPKAVNLSREIDKALGMERKVVGEKKHPTAKNGKRSGEKSPYQAIDNLEGSFQITAPATELAKKYDGFYSALKPGWETILLMRKPPEGTLAQNVIKYGTGGLNIDATRIKTSDNLNGGTYAQNPTPRAGQDMWTSTRKSDTQCFRRGGAGEYQQPTGRWPANVVLSHSPMCRLIGTKQIKNTSGSVTGEEPSEVTKEIYGKFDHRESFKSYGDENGIEEVEDWECVEGCPVLELNRQSGVSNSAGGSRGAGGQNGRYSPIGAQPEIGALGYGDTGGAARYFHNFRYSAKTPTWERNIGCSDLEQKTAGECTGGRQEGSAGLNNPRAGAGRVGGNKNDHPTVKPLNLLHFLSKLITPPDGVILDPFLGSGSTGMAAVLSGFRFIGIELDPHYFEIAQHRIQAAEDGEVQLNEDTGKVEKVEKKKENAGEFNFYDDVK